MPGNGGADMPMHDWSNVTKGQFHDFHAAWLAEIRRVLMSGLLPEGYYASVEQHVMGFIPDVLSFRESPDDFNATSASATTLLQAPVAPTVQTGVPPYYRQNELVTVRQSDGDQLVAVVEVVSPNNKNSRVGIEGFLRKTASLLGRGIHLVILDTIRPGRFDPQGMHGAIRQELTSEPIQTSDKPLTVASYEAAGQVRAFVQALAAGDVMGDTPLFLEEDCCVMLPTESSYMAAFTLLNRRLRRVLEALK